MFSDNTDRFMKITDLYRISTLYFNLLDVARALNISKESAAVTCSRYVKNGFLIRLRRNLFMLREKWKYIGQEELFEIANIIQVPSYISLTTGLSFYNFTTQVQQNFIESVSLNRTKKVIIEEKTFNYTKIQKTYYLSFDKINNFFIASPEKSLVDTLYLQFFGKYRLDSSAVFLDRINKANFMALINKYPPKIRNYCINFLNYR